MLINSDLFAFELRLSRLAARNVEDCIFAAFTSPTKIGQALSPRFSFIAETLRNARTMIT